MTDADDEFAAQIAKVFAALREKQEPLGADFEAVWNDNIESLYEP